MLDDVVALAVLLLLGAGAAMVRLGRNGLGEAWTALWSAPAQLWRECPTPAQLLRNPLLYLTLSLAVTMIVGWWSIAVQKK